MLRISLEESLRRSGNTGAAEEVGRLRQDSELFHRVMGLLRNTQMEHGTCQPRDRRACTHCNAADDLKKIVAEYKGQPIVPA